MLETLRITNYALIEALEVNLREGLNVLTGETGAGKSIIVDAMGTLLGGRADSQVIRSGTKGARVEGICVLPLALREELAPFLQEHGLEGSGDELILTREIIRTFGSLARAAMRNPDGSHPYGQLVAHRRHS